MTESICVITTCTSRKVDLAARADRAVLPGFAPDPELLPAEELYIGEQHRRLMDGVGRLREQRDVAVWVISARAGLIAGSETLAPYDESFTRLSPDALRSIADRLRIAESLRDLCARPAALTLMLAGNDYFDAARLEAPVDWASPTLVLASPSRAGRVPPHARVRVVAISQALAKQWSLPLTLLKGEIVRGILAGIADGRLEPAELIADPDTTDRWCRPPASAIAC